MLRCAGLSARGHQPNSGQPQYTTAASSLLPGARVSGSRSGCRERGGIRDDGKEGKDDGKSVLARIFAECTESLHAQTDSIRQRRNAPSLAGPFNYSVDSILYTAVRRPPARKTRPGPVCRGPACRSVCGDVASRAADTSSRGPSSHLDLAEHCLRRSLRRRCQRRRRKARGGTSTEQRPMTSSAAVPPLLEERSTWLPAHKSPGECGCCPSLLGSLVVNPFPFSDFYFRNGAIFRSEPVGYYEPAGWSAACPAGPKSLRLVLAPSIALYVDGRQLHYVLRLARGSRALSSRGRHLATKTAPSSTPRGGVTATRLLPFVAPRSARRFRHSFIAPKLAMKEKGVFGRSGEGT
ncbi:hypothetical protein MTO96_027261 [Rhipicephalus appendiculatus]